MPRRRRFGRVRALASGRFQARYLGPDGIDRPAPHTFSRRQDAERWLSAVETDIQRGAWANPDGASVTLGVFATAWIKERPGLRPKTVQLYGGLLRLHIEPTLGLLALGDLNPAQIRRWRADLLEAGVGPVTVAKAYRLLRAVLGTAVTDRLIRENPCQIKGASTECSPERPVLTVAQVYAIADAMPKRYRVLVLLATFASMRWGELAALVREDVDLGAGTVQIRVALVELVDGSLVVGPPKSAAGRRVVSLPSFVVAELRRHLADYVGRAPTAPVFPGPKGALLRRSNFQQHWRRALLAAGVPAVHFHDLRHTGNTLTAHAGATLSDLMTRMGHSTTRAARIYLHTTSARDRVVADALGKLVEAERKPGPESIGHTAGTDPEN
jgi:integrase